MTYFNRIILSSVEQRTRTGFAPTAFGIASTLAARPTLRVTPKTPSVGFEGSSDVSTNVNAVLVAGTGGALVVVMLETDAL